MQHRYVGDIGDYVKLGLLRALSDGRRLGVAWWLHPDEGPPGDGRHIGYLEKPGDWRHYDADLFDHLQSVVRSGQRHISALENHAILPKTKFYSELMPVGTAPRARPEARRTWFDIAARELEDCDVLFLDPDNGLEPRAYRPTGKKSGKCVRWSEVQTLRRHNRPMIVYHHQTRFKGGHHEEIRHIGAELRKLGFDQIDALRASPYSPRLFLIIDADSAFRERAAGLAARWSGKLTWHTDI